MSMNPQKYPKTKIKKGAELYAVTSWVQDDGKVRIEVESWIVTSIRKDRVCLTQKEKGVTWIKRSNKHFDWGFADNIPWTHRNRFQVGDPLPYGIYTTVLAAYRYAISDTKDSIHWYKQRILIHKREGWKIPQEFFDELDERELELKALKRRIKTHQKKMKKK